MFGWVITRDYINKGERDNEIGTGDYHGEEPKIPMNAVHFRLLDGDGNLYFGGMICHTWLTGTADVAFSPLDCLKADYGLTTMEYYDPTTNQWEEL
jgi:hypothetical protein